jgi:hypothetical protein
MEKLKLIVYFSKDYWLLLAPCKEEDDINNNNNNNNCAPAGTHPFSAMNCVDTLGVDSTTMSRFLWICDFPLFSRERAMWTHKCASETFNFNRFYSTNFVFCVPRDEYDTYIRNGSFGEATVHKRLTFCGFCTKSARNYHEDNSRTCFLEICLLVCLKKVFQQQR